VEAGKLFDQWRFSETLAASFMFKTLPAASLIFYRWIRHNKKREMIFFITLSA